MTDDEMSDEDLVAYLDQEASAEQSRRIETRLLTDDTLRAKLAELESPFDLLDHLPRSEADASFTRTTLSRATLAEVRRAEARTWRWRLGQVALAVGLVVGVASLGGAAFLVAKYRAEEPNRQFLADLSVLQHFDALVLIDDLAWLERLRHDAIFSVTEPPGQIPDGFGERSDSVPSSESDRSDAGASLLNSSGSDAWAADRTERSDRDWPADLAALAPSEARRIVLNADRLADLPAEEQTRLRLMARSIDAHPDAEDLWRIADQYLKFISQREAPVRAELRDMPAEARLARIRQIQQNELLDDLVAHTQLPKSDAKAVLDWVAAHQDRHMDEYTSIVGGPGPRLPSRIANDDLPWTLRSILFWRYEQRHGTPMPRPSTEELSTLQASVSPQIGEKLNQARTIDEKVRLIWGWSKNAAVQSMMPTRDDLTAFHDELPEDEKQALIGLTPDEFQRRLRGLYFRSRSPGPPFGVGGRDFRGGRPPRPPGFPDPPPSDGSPFGPPPFERERRRGGPEPGRPPERMPRDEETPSNDRRLSTYGLPELPGRQDDRPDPADRPPLPPSPYDRP